MSHCRATQFYEFLGDIADFGACDRAMLAEVAAVAGLLLVEVEDQLAGETGLDAVRVGEEQGRRLGVSGVPFFVVNGNVVLSGTQPPELFLQAFEQSTQSALDGEAGQVDPATGKREC